MQGRNTELFCVVMHQIAAADRPVLQQFFDALAVFRVPNRLRQVRRIIEVYLKDEILPALGRP
jgi:hypothetical protein